MPSMIDYGPNRIAFVTHTVDKLQREHLAHPSQSTLSTNTPHHAQRPKFCTFIYKKCPTLHPVPSPAKPTSPLRQIAGADAARGLQNGEVVFAIGVRSVVQLTLSTFSFDMHHRGRSASTQRGHPRMFKRPGMFEQHGLWLYRRTNFKREEEWKWVFMGCRFSVG
jgi:hypothetical protein